MFELRLLAPEEKIEIVSDALEALDALSVSVEDADAQTEAEQALFGEPGMPPPSAGWQRSRVIALFPDEAAARDAGEVLSAQDFFEGSVGRVETFDSMLCAHVLEHVSQEVADELIAQYLPYVRHGGQVVFITPQEVGFRSDETHIRWVDGEVAKTHLAHHGLEAVRSYSFPFPRPLGKVFKYNEFVTLGRKL